MAVRKKEIEIRIGRDFANDIGHLVDHPEKIEKEPNTVIWVESADELASLLSPRKLELLHYLEQLSDEAVSKISRKLGRKREAVSRDLHSLALHGLVGLEKKGKEVIPSTKAKKITILLEA